MANLQVQAEKKPNTQVEDKSVELQNAANRVNVRTHTEVKFLAHLQDLLKEGAGDEGGGKKFGLTYGHSIMAAVVYERYEQADDELDIVLDIKQDYPDFGTSAGRYVQHAKSLIKAMKAKRSVGKLPHVSRAKQKELINALTDHFRDLRACMVNIEKIERRIRRKDLSATRYFLVTLYWCSLGVFLFAFMIYGAPLYWYAVHMVMTSTAVEFVIRGLALILPL